MAKIIKTIITISALTANFAYAAPVKILHIDEIEAIRMEAKASEYNVPYKSSATEFLETNRTRAKEFRKELGFKEKVVQYNGEKKSYNNWLQEFRAEGNEQLAAELALLWKTYPDIKLSKNKKIYNRAFDDLSRLKIMELWNDKIVKNPNSKNARSALCAYAGEIGGALSEIVNKGCDKSFTLNADKILAARVTHKKITPVPPIK